jgi:hypothetical protein
MCIIINFQQKCNYSVDQFTKYGQLLKESEEDDTQKFKYLLRG